MTRILSKEQEKILKDQGVTVHYQTKKQKSLSSDMYRKYGITMGDYQTMNENQKGLCLICFGKSKGKRLSIDHCHETNIVRGLLCDKCNLGLGCFNDDIGRMKNAISYLDTFEARKFYPGTLIPQG